MSSMSLLSQLNLRLTVELLVFLSVFTQICSAWTAKWIDLDLDVGSSISPPRSGHVAFGLDENIYVFGGYAEDSDTSSRYPTNDLWCFGDGDERGWTLVKHKSSSEPQPRLAAAAVSCKLGDTTTGIVLGGWDSQEEGSGGVILKDILLFSSKSGDGGSWKEFPTDLKEPTSRLCAVPLVDKTSPSPESKVLIHNHRCLDHILLLDLETSKIIKQSVSGTVPSARGLHSMVQLPGTTKILLFGGAAQNGLMSNEVFVLDTKTWIWENCSPQDTENNVKAAPIPRASPCLVALDEKSCILFGGASRSDAGLHGCSDTWLLELVEGATNDGSSTTTKAKWTQLNEDKSTQAPPGRNAATLTPILSKSLSIGGDTDENNKKNTHYFLLSGGWYPFRNTYSDNFVLKVTKN